MSLTDSKIRNIRASEKPFKLSDGRGMYLQVMPTGGRLWRFRYRFGGKQKLLAMGAYPDVSLKLARERLEAARKLLAEGVDPSENRKAQKATQADSAADSFGVIAREWFARYSRDWASSHATRVIRRFELNIFPWLDRRPIRDITTPELLVVIRQIEDRGVLETAHRALQTCGQVFRYAVTSGRAERDPTRDLRGALPPFKHAHFAAATEPAAYAQVLRALDSYKGSLVVRTALHVAPLVFVRPGELRHAKWEEIDLDTAEWRFRVTKTGTDHIVPLARQAVDALKALKPLTGSGMYVFPSARGPSRPMSENAVLVAMRSVGIERGQMTGHGFRAAARTMLDEVLHVRPDYIEHQLAHAVRDANGRAYNRTTHLPERREMMQQWADYLDELKTKS